MKTILVTGVTGRQGGAVASSLLCAGWHVHGLTRDTSKPAARAMADMGVGLVQGDLDDPDSLRPALRDVYGVFSVQTPYKLDGVSSEISEGKRLADLAKAAGVKHFVYSSVGGAERNTGISYFDSKWEIEQHIRELEMPATIIRPVYFMDNFSSPQMLEYILAGRLTVPVKPTTRLQMIAVADIGNFAALAFNDAKTYIGKAIELAGDEMTMPQAAECLSRHLGTSVRFEQTPIEDIRRESPDVATMYEWFDTHGYRAPIADLRTTYPELMDFETWLAKTSYGKIRQPVEASAQR